MLDFQAYAFDYEPDTEVCDEPELTMQVYKGSAWHRRMPDLATTSCGIVIHSQFDPTRREQICLPLCEECFTKFELERAAMTLAKEQIP